MGVVRPDVVDRSSAGSIHSGSCRFDARLAVRRTSGTGRVGLTRWEPQALLKEHAVEPRLGPTDMAAAAVAVETIRDAE